MPFVLWYSCTTMSKVSTSYYTLCLCVPAHHLATFFCCGIIINTRQQQNNISVWFFYFSNNIFSEQVLSLKNMTNLIASQNLSCSIQKWAVIWVFFYWLEPQGLINIWIWINIWGWQGQYGFHISFILNMIEMDLWTAAWLTVVYTDINTDMSLKSYFFIKL